jgi:hypothetical protein
MMVQLYRLMFIVTVNETYAITQANCEAEASLNSLPHSNPQRAINALWGLGARNHHGRSLGMQVSKPMGPTIGKSRKTTAVFPVGQTWLFVLLTVIHR